MRPHPIARAIALWSLGASLPGAQAQQTPPAADPPVQRVEVTGSALKRVDAEGALPVSTLTHADIERSGATDVETLVSSLPYLSQANASPTTQGLGASNFGLASMSLRGLGDKRTLVLMNGQRLPNFANGSSSVVDINAIPASAIDKVEVLRDGASALYGSDAMAGVVNFIMRREAQGVELNAYSGNPTRQGGGGITRVGLVAGWGEFAKDGHSLMVAADTSRDNALFGRDRDFAAWDWDPSPAGLWENSSTPSGRLYNWDPNFTYGQQPAVVGSGNFYGQTVQAPDHCADTGSTYHWFWGDCRYNGSPVQSILPQTERTNVLASARWQLGPDTEWFADAVYSKGKQKVTQLPSPYSPVFLVQDELFNPPETIPTILLRTSNAHYGVSGADPLVDGDLAVSYRAFDLGNRVQVDHTDSIHLASGFKGTWSDWDYSATLGYNRSGVRDVAEAGFQRQSLLVNLLNDPAGPFQDGNLANGEFNPFAQYQDATTQAAMRTANFSGTTVKVAQSKIGVDLAGSRALYDNAAGQASLALGAGVDRERLDFAANPVMQTADVTGYAGSYLPFKVSRQHAYAFTEAVLPIVKGLEGDLALRYDHYQSVGSTTNPKLSLRAQPMKALVLRGSVGTGFRAPSLPELYSPEVSGASPLIDDPFSGTSNQFPSVTGGNPALKPEKSRQFSLGLVSEPMANLSFSADYFHIRVDNPVLTLPSQLIVNRAYAGDAYFLSLITLTDDGSALASFDNRLRNGGRMEVSGVDIDLKWRIAKWDARTLTAQLAGSWMGQYDLTDPAGNQQASVGKSVDESNAPLNAVQNGGVIFRWRHALTLAYAEPTWGVALTQNFQSAYDDAQPVNDYWNGEPFKPHHVAAFSTYDLHADYTGFKDLKLGLGVKNLLDTNPPRVAGNTYYWQMGYDSTYYDARARFAYVSASLKF